MFYDKFCELCNKKGITPSAVATQIKFSRGTITAWKKNGGTPNADLLTKIADYFGVSTDYLLSDDNRQPEKVEYLNGGTDEKKPAPENKGGCNVVKILGRDGSATEKVLTDDQCAAIKALIDQLPEANV